MNVFLRGARNYVQGTQIIARAADTLRNGPWKLERAGFSQITRNFVSFASQDEDGKAIGRLHFSSDENATNEIYILDSGQPAPQIDLPILAQAVRHSLDSTADSQYSFSNVEAFEDMLNAIIIAIKSEHSLQFQGCTDVWLTGMRGMTLPVTGPFPENGVIKLQLMRSLATEHGQQTLWRMGIHSKDGTEFTRGAVTFAYKPRD
jgi:hypothetical protein